MAVDYYERALDLFARQLDGEKKDQTTIQQAVDDIVGTLEMTRALREKVEYLSDGAPLNQRVKTFIDRLKEFKSNMLSSSTKQ